MPGDVVLQDRFFTGTAWGRGAFPPQRGDVVFFTPPPALIGLVEDTAAKAGARGPSLDTRQFVKRVGAVAGDRVSVDARGDVRVGGELVRGLCGAFPPPSLPRFAEAEGRVARGTVFMLGDCPAQSVDSRSWGSLPIDNISGRPLLRVWPPWRAGPL